MSPEAEDEFDRSMDKEADLEEFGRNGEKVRLVQNQGERLVEPHCQWKNQRSM
jgi:hypothetical protein